ncbi:hypothetical protein G6F46_015089 [Rhizopus delemar]|nr:hypothetical protein G6F46_015089 [Rhizopus delemar]
MRRTHDRTKKSVVGAQPFQPSGEIQNAFPFARRRGRCKPRSGFRRRLRSSRQHGRIPGTAAAAAGADRCSAGPGPAAAERLAGAAGAVRRAV